MRYNDWGDLGDRIRDIIDSAVREGNYGSLNETVREVIEGGGDLVRDVLDGALGGRRYGSRDYDRGQYENQDYDRQNTKSRYGNGEYGAENNGNRYGNSEYYENPEHNARAYETRDDHGYQQPPFGRGQRITPQKRPKNELQLYKETGGDRAKGLLTTAFGALMTAGMGLGFLIAGGGALLFNGFSGAGSWMGDGPWMAYPYYISSAYYVIVGILGVGTALGALILAKGLKKLGMLKRFRSYTDLLGERTYCSLEKLSRAVGKPLKFVKKDVRKMISGGWFLEGHVDDQETCLITSNETYSQYEATREQLAARAKEAEAAKAAEEAKKAKEKVSAETQAVLDRGNEFLEKIRKSNDAIPGEEISAKISRMELIVQKIFDRAKTHPEIIPDLEKLMSYYLPMTVKLLDAYEDMDSQPIQGENIKNSKKEIEDTIDTLNVAFEKLLDSVFQDAAWDLSSDITVLHTILAQEGLTEDEFAKLKREAAKTANGENNH